MAVKTGLPTSMSVEQLHTPGEDNVSGKGVQSFLKLHHKRLIKVLFSVLLLVAALSLIIFLCWTGGSQFLAVESRNLNNVHGEGETHTVVYERFQGYLKWASRLWMRTGTTASHSVSNTMDEAKMNVTWSRGIFGDGTYPDEGIEKLSENLTLSSYSHVHDQKEHSVPASTLPDIRDKLPQDAFIIMSNELPRPRFMTSVGNGHVGTVIDSDTVLMNGLYNGRHGDSHRARIPSMVSCNITGFHPHQPYKPRRAYTLNMMNGMYLETIHGDDFVLEKKIYAHRQLKRLLVTEIDVVRVYKAGQMAMKVNMENNRGKPSDDVNFDTITDAVECNGTVTGCRYMHGKTNISETPSSDLQDIHIFYDPIPTHLDVPVVPSSEKSQRTKWTFYASFAQDKDDAKNYYELAAGYTATDYLLQRHVAAWHKLWTRGVITLEGNLTLARAVSGAMYYILSSIQLEYDPSDPFIGLSPSDLAHGVTEDDYLGHVFWDQDTWMYPGVLMMFPDLGKLLLRTRLRTLAAAKENAKLNGNIGAQFPWETAHTGSEVCPGEVYAKNELHISGDISFAFRQYMYMTKDMDFYILEGGRNLVNDISEFWASRVSMNETTKTYDILNVMPPDEYKRSINNSVYTNYVAALALKADHDISSTLKLVATGDPDWIKIAENLVIPFDDELQYHPEYEGYQNGTSVKQADVILIGFPFMMNMSQQVRRNDLTLYDEVTDPKGPAMTWTMFAIGWLELGEHEKANKLMERNMDHIQEPFQVWSEVTGGEGGVNFITGMGGLLQSMIFGYGGFRIRQDHLEFNPSLPDQVTRLTLTGISYQGGVFCFCIETSGLAITLTSKQYPFLQFKVKIPSAGREMILQLGKTVKIGLEKSNLIRV
ncbi:protein-glucosylgalactosylhydroxylysine glucosidase-like isoform X2 [Lineus longissimus]|uniref:protein-glucosylgalactosylhydroxylysine glucosidase-like isoform X2 n=1 Tax=Lineus longissimus TaxID=88925 RepID=UPI002B4F41D5